jgi:serine/threonine protein kinase
MSTLTVNTQRRSINEIDVAFFPAAQGAQPVECIDSLRAILSISPARTGKKEDPNEYSIQFTAIPLAIDRQEEPISTDQVACEMQNPSRNSLSRWFTSRGKAQITGYINLRNSDAPNWQPVYILINKEKFETICQTLGNGAKELRELSKAVGQAATTNQVWTDEQKIAEATKRMQTRRVEILHPSHSAEHPLPPYKRTAEKVLLLWGTGITHGGWWEKQTQEHLHEAWTREVGRGTQGRVSEGTLTTPHVTETVAIKRLRLEEKNDEAAINTHFTRMEQISQRLYKYREQGILIPQCWECNGHRVLVAPRYDEDLQTLLKNKQLTTQSKLNIIESILKLVALTHQESVIHSDLKLENIVVHHREDGRSVLGIIDWDCARVNENNAQMLGGTSLYLPPEFYQGSIALTPAHDCWAAGVIAQEILTGKLPEPIEGAYRMALQEKFNPATFQRTLIDNLKQCHNNTYTQWWNRQCRQSKGSDLALLQLLNPKPKKRATIQQVLKALKT